MIGRRGVVALAWTAVIAGTAPAAVSLVSAQVRKCYVEVCSTTDGKTTCYEKEVTCATEQ